MLTFTLLLFWTAVAMLVYVYAGFPAITVLRGWVWRRPFARDEATPRVTLVIGAHNEAQAIGARLDNVAALDYPRDRLEVIVASDGSTDDTEDVVRGYADRGVTLLSLPRGGKCRALNAAARIATGDVLAFSDANTAFDPGALRALVRPFADPTVGGVAGDQRYLSPAQTGDSAHGERWYWNLDRLLKRAQSRSGNVTSATGAIYAIRRRLFTTLPDGAVDDFVNSTGVIAQGYRLVFAPDAVAFEAPADSMAFEFRRKIRVMTQGFMSVWVMRRLLNPVRHGFYAVQVFSHKVLRRLAAFPLLACLGSSAVLAPVHPIYGVAFAALVGVAALAAAGAILGRTAPGRSKLFTIPLYFVMVNAAAIAAFVRFLVGPPVVMWNTQRPGEGVGLETRG